ncbi:MAG: DNA methyltransferase [Treponema sp.]|jgi:predicted helicase|nr:DNA methyltransferase [Treponema sp.]
MNAPTSDFQSAAITRYIAETDKIYRAGNATEHSYRPALKSLLEAVTSGLTITNEPRHIACGAPDYIITRDSIPLGYIEAKDISVGLNNKANKTQFERYKQSLGNLIITDYLTFQLFVEGNQVISTAIANESGDGIVHDKKQYGTFVELINKFTGYSGKTIYQSSDLARMMAAKTKLLAEIIKTALSEKNIEGDTLSGQLEGFRKILVHDLSETSFADMYAQTLAYGLFAARLNQRNSQTFNREIAAHLVPKTNPFLRKFFQYIAGFDLDSRIRWIVDALADLFNCVAVEEILKEFSKANQDPYIHFYETFIAEYDPALRESRGVYYTPLPAVQFIVKAVDDILQKEFYLAQGLADNSKIKLPGKSTKKQSNQETGCHEFHKVQILDPAAGTGTFLSEVVNLIHSRFTGQKGMWAGYCSEHLSPRLNGFEILMASYAMAHFKLDMTLRETGVILNNKQNGKDKRLHIYLTNTLEEAPERVPELFMAQWLAREAEEAREVKQDIPVMVVMGNPPYNVSTQNKNDWIDGLIAEYKKDLNEKNIQPLSDDYIKFIRYGQYLIDKNTNGILAYISNNSFIDGIIHRKMRKTLLESFDKIYIFDLHGSSKKRETTLDGKNDGNVFDIQQGVSINIFIKKTVKSDTAKVYHCDLFGKRETKYSFLMERNLSTIKWKELKPQSPHYYFVPKDFSLETEYESGFGINILFPIYSSGIKTHDDNHLVSVKPFSSKNNQVYNYRPFDIRYIDYDLKKVKRHRYNIMQHFLEQENVAIIAPRQAITGLYGIFISKIINDINFTGTAGQYGAGLTFPLYIYPYRDTLGKSEKRHPNLNLDIVKTIAEKINLHFNEEKEDKRGTFTPIDILDYIYAVLHSPAYRIKYKEFLKIDFPRVPYPADTKQFKTMAEFGAKLRTIHLLEDVVPSEKLARYPIEGSNTIDTITYKEKKVWINKQQYFESVPSEVWSFYIGGYQPAQKWLKDRKGRTLNFDEIQHYQKIIHALHLTMDIQGRIEGVISMNDMRDGGNE